MMWWPLLRNSIWLLLIVSLAEHVVTFSLPGCNIDKHFDIVQNQQPSLTCFGLSPGQNIYWSITDPSGQKETRLAECKKYMQGCSRLVEGYNVSRERRTITTLQFLNASLITDGSTIKCSRFNNMTHVTCKLYVVPAKALTLTECNSTVHFDIAQHQQPYLTCTGFQRLFNIYWAITDPSGNEIRIAECTSCGPPCPPCSQLVSGYNVSREKVDSTTLQFLNPSLVSDGSTIKCSSFNNMTDASCQLFVGRDGKTSSAFPVTAVAGGVAGFISLVAVVVVIVVVFTVRRPKQEESPRREETASTPNGAADNYDGLHMPDVGLPSVYSETGPRPVSSSSSPDYIDLYHGLDISEVGQRSEYSQFGQNI